MAAYIEYYQEIPTHKNHLLKEFPSILYHKILKKTTSLYESINSNFAVVKLTNYLT